MLDGNVDQEDIHICQVLPSLKGKPTSEEFRRGRGSFSIQKFILQIFAIIDDTSVMNFRKKLQYNFPKMSGGGSKAVWNFSENSSVLDVSDIPKSQQPVCKAVAVDHGDKNLLSQDPTGTLTRC